MKFDLIKTKIELDKFGYSVFEQKNKDFENLSFVAQSICKDKSYERGTSFHGSVRDFKENNILDLVVCEKFRKFFQNYNCKPQDIFLTHEFQNAVARNNYLHFDRLRSLKVLVYLTDVCENSGPFCVCPETHSIGMKFRRKFANLKDYEEKKNRVDIDYPDIEYDLKKITGKAGTTIVFDSDVFHCGGNIVDGNKRILVRSHWYPEYNWRVFS